MAVEQSPGRVSQSMCMIAVVQALSGSTTAEVITSYIQKNRDKGSLVIDRSIS